MKLISFILAMYNVEKYVSNCIESLYRQNISKDQFEIICIDDGSTDGTVQVVEQLIQTGKDNILLLKQDNKGPGMARNLGLHNSSSKYILFVDSDDYIADSSICALIQNAEKYETDIVYFNYTYTSDDSLNKQRFCDTDIVGGGIRRKKVRIYISPRKRRLVLAFRFFVSSKIRYTI